MEIKIITTSEQDTAITRLRKYVNKQPSAVQMTDKEFLISKINPVIQGLIEEAERTCDGLQILQLLKKATHEEKQQILKILKAD